MKVDLHATGTDAVRDTLRRLGGALVKSALAETAEDAERYIGAEAGEHTKTGALFRSIYATPSSDGWSWEIGHDLQIARHALFVHWGTKPHKIRPRDKRVLRFPFGGQFRFAREVNHPGYEGDPWQVRAAARAPAQFERFIAQRIAQEMGT